MKKLLFTFIMLSSFTVYATEINMSCKTLQKDFIDGRIKRCENTEVICYVSNNSDSSIFCKFKEQ